MDILSSTDFEAVCDTKYDYIIVGSGLGGGLLARQLLEKGKEVLLVEKGGLSFSTHCLNSARPHWQKGGSEGPSQDNDIVYRVVKQKVDTVGGSAEFVGGPVYGFGGRSTVWGLFSPRVTDTALTTYFPTSIKSFLVDGGGYDTALNILTNSPPGDVNYPNELTFAQSEVASAKYKLKEAIKEFNKSIYGTNSTVEVTTAPIAAEFAHSNQLYYFPQGAYSTVDYLLDKLYARDPKLTVLANAEVTSVEFGGASDTSVKRLKVRELSGEKRVGFLTANKAAILCAGTIDTARIALRSGLQIPSKSKNLVGLGLTDHEIWGVRFEIEKSSTITDPVKLQSQVQIHGHSALLNVCVNANSFLDHEFAPTQCVTKTKKDSSTVPKKDTLTVTLEFESKLNDANKVINAQSVIPRIEIHRVPVDDHSKFTEDMQSLATAIRNQFAAAVGKDKAPALTLAGFGVVAHEVGTMRMDGPSKEDKGVVDEHLRVHGTSNLFVCDLSVIPVSPAANPSLTLAALAIRLADKLAKL